VSPKRRRISFLTPKKKAAKILPSTKEKVALRTNNSFMANPTKRSTLIVTQTG
jgi:hypothetical protein